MMNRIAFVSLAIAVCAAAAVSAAEPQIVFKAYDVYADTGEKALGAYQIEVTYGKDTVKIVGIEGGEPASFEEAPRYDPKGLQGGRIIIAAFTTDEESAPKGRARVARIHVSIEGDDAAQMVAKLMTAADAGGTKMDIGIELVEAKPEKEAKQTEEGTENETTEE
jgi:hypothetical protein